MSLIDLLPPALRPWAIALVLLAIAGAAAGGAWTVQDWRYGQTLAEQARQCADQAKERVDAVLATQTSEQAKRVALEGRLKVNDETHYKELSNAKYTQQRLSDRLATADVRLSVLLAAPIGAGADELPATTSAGGLVHGGARARLDPAHAQRIIGITDAGDQGLIALAACQVYIREVSR
ncbi:lysis system i-spanin subunit Rz [Pseudomonas mandelii]|uniref:lysis system i-spanin subunit Rz n=1 Tax=Pseudomonas mandelii TaxID=75612 RepID=UPI0005184A53|nr:lysis system i-spanin subunit Rz [Pseudomonas mandelii]